MLTVAPKPSGGIVTLPASSITGPISVSVSGEAPHLSTLLSGLGTGWTTDEEGIRLRPLTTPAQFRLTLALDQTSSESFTLVGAQVFHHTPGNVSTVLATFFFPASSSGHVVLDLLHDIPSDGNTVTYKMLIGVKDSSGVTHWPDPSIAFDPQGT